ncbi:MAG: peptidoglycan editing factor PgeF [Bacteroidota bacterium]
MPTTERTHIIPQIFQPWPSVRAAQSTRLGGTSPAPFQSLNLGLHTDDDPVNVAENRKRFFAHLGCQESQVAHSHQVHATEVLQAVQAGAYEGYDALVTQKRNLLLCVTTADCVPILLFDPRTESVAAVHAGWKGSHGQIVLKTIDKMVACFGSRPADCHAYIGPCIDECSFEVDADVADFFVEEFKRWDDDKQKFFVDLKKVNRSQLLSAGIPEGQIEVSPHSTVLQNEWFFSHRKEKGRTGRMLCAIGIFDE